MSVKDRCFGKEFENGCVPKTVFEWNIVAATLHALEALAQIVILAVYFWGRQKPIPQIQLSVPVSTWNTGDVVNASCYASDEHCDYVQPVIREYNGTSWNLFDRHVPYAAFNVEWAVISFFLLSSLFQYVAACGKIQKDKYGGEKDKNGNTYETYYDYEDLVVNDDRNPLRFIEYSFSASLMLAIISTQSGIQSFNTIWLICVCCAGTQLFGLVAEYFRSRLVRKSENKQEISLQKFIEYGEENEDMSLYASWFQDELTDEETNYKILMLLTHGAGYFLFLSAYGIIISHFYVSNGQCGSSKAPEWITGLVWGQFALFSSFGLVQFVSIVFNKTCRNNCGTGCMLFQRDIIHKITCGNLKLPICCRVRICGLLADIEMFYIFLSLVAKSVLCWTLFGYVLVEMID